MIHVSNRRVKTAAETAALSYEYVLLHPDLKSRNYLLESRVGPVISRWTEKSGAHHGRLAKPNVPFDQTVIFNYCKKKGN